MNNILKDVLALYNLADLPKKNIWLVAFLFSNFMLSLFELIGIAAVGALLVQMFNEAEMVDFYILKFDNKVDASFFILSLWLLRAGVVIVLNRFNFLFIQRVKSAIQQRQCEVAFASKARSDQTETGSLFTALTNEVQMITGQVFTPLTLALAEIILVLLSVTVALFIFPLGMLLASSILLVGYTLTNYFISPLTKSYGNSRLKAEKNWTEKVVNMFSLRQEADVYQVKDKLKQQLNKEIKKSNHASGKFYSINPINRSALETIGITSILGVLVFAEYFEAPNESAIFIVLALVRMLPSSTRILSAIQSYKFAAPVVAKQIKYLKTEYSSLDSRIKENISFNGSIIKYKFKAMISPAEIEFDLFKKGLIVVTGESGIGKSVMLEELLELLNTKRDAGELNLKDFSFSSQNCLPIEANINRNLLFFRKLSKNNLHQGIELLKSWKIPKSHFAENLMVTDFSGGQKRRVSVARALNCNNGLIFLDEPTSGLDVEIAKLVTDSIKNKAKNNLIIVITHDDYLIKVADKLINLKRQYKNG